MINNDYENFKELQKYEKENCDFKIEHKDRGSNITIVAPHGGKIEDKTTEIAKLIAGDSFNYYSFIGQKSNNNRDLHITSHKFDEPRALELVCKLKHVIAIHGCKDKQDRISYGKKIFIGGLDENLIDKLQEALKNASLPVSFLLKFAGKEKNNICNRGTLGKGVQFELTSSARNDGELCGKFIAVVSKCLKQL